MRAAVLYGVNDVRIEDVSLAPPGPGQALVRLAASGVCQTQLNEVRGRKGEDRNLPHLMGHEGSGTVQSIGFGVTKVKPGDRVILSWIKGSGHDARGGIYTAADGRRINAGSVITFAEEAVVSENRVTPFTGDISFEEAALIACAVATGAGMIRNTAALRPGQSVAIFGLGGVGLSAVQAAVAAGASEIIAIDIHDHKLEAARRFGATRAVNASIGDLVATIGTVDVAIDASGARPAMEAAHRVVKKNGGLAIIAGNLPAGSTISIDPFGLIEGRRIVGSWGGDTVPDRDFPEYASRAAQGTLRIRELISHRVRLEELCDVLAAQERGEVTRAVVLL